MAKLISPIQFTGKLGGLSFYHMKGVEGIVVRQSWGPDRKRIRRDPCYRRLRENNTEFACAVMAGKAIRQAFAPLRRFAGCWFHSRLTGLLYQAIRQSNEGVRGKRPLDLARHATLLEGLQWNPRNPFGATLTTGPMPLLNPPAGATHYRIIHAAATLSKYIYDDRIQGYRPEDPLQNGNCTQSDTGWLSMGSDPRYLTDRSRPIPPTTQPAPSTISVVAVEFALFADGAFHPLSDHAAMQITRISQPQPAAPAFDLSFPSKLSPGPEPAHPWAFPFDRRISRLLLRNEPWALSSRQALHPNQRHRCIVVEPYIRHTDRRFLPAHSPPR